MRRATLSDLTNGKSAAEMALRLEKAFGVSMDLLLRMQAGYAPQSPPPQRRDRQSAATNPDLCPAIDWIPRPGSRANKKSRPRYSLIR